MEPSRKDSMKAGNTLSHILEKEFLTCTICMHAYETPKVLNCNHSFCRKCLAVYIPRNAKTSGREQGFDCPICRRFIPAPTPKGSSREWVDKLQTNFVFLSMQEMISQTSSLRNQPEKGQLAKEEIVTDWHKKTQKSTCGTHGKELDFYCKSHDAIMCGDCVLISHKNCETIIKCQEASLELRKKVTDLRKSSINREEIVTELKSDIATQLDRVSETRLTIERDIKTSKGELVRKLDDLERNMLEELENVFSEQKQLFDERMFQCDMIRCSCRESIKVFIDPDQCTSTEIIRQIVDRQPASQAEQILLREICTKTQYSELRNDMNKSLRNVLMSATKLGELNVVTSPLKLPQGALMYTPGQTEVKYSDVTLTGFSVKDNADVQTTTDKKYCLITGVTFLEDGRVVLMDRNNEKVKLFSESMEYLSEVILRGSSFDITGTGNSEVAISLPTKERVRFVGVEVNTLKFLDREIDTKQVCYGIDYGQSNLFVCCLQKNKLPECVKIYGAGDVLIKEIHSNSNGGPLFSSLNSSYVSVCPDGNLVSVVDQNPEKIVVVSFLLNGEVKSEIPLPNWSDNARGIAFYGKTLIVALQNRTLCMISDPQQKTCEVTELSSSRPVVYSNTVAVSPKMDKIALTQSYPYYNCNDSVLQVLIPEF